MSRALPPTTMQESMAACILAGIRDCTWITARRWLLENPQEAAPYLRAGMLAIEHFPYLQQLREARREGLYFWLGAEAEAA